MRNFKGGFFAILALLVVAAIGMIIYLMSFSAIFPDAGKLPGNLREQQKPWQLEHLLVGPNKVITMPRKPKPIIDKPIKLSCPVMREDKNRGTANIRIDLLGETHGDWSCEYQTDKEKHKISASFNGNIDVKKTYVINQDEDKSKLFLIAKGGYAHDTINLQTNEKTTEKGVIYLLGWLNPDYSAFGTLTVTTDRSWSAVYQWKSGNLD